MRADVLHAGEKRAEEFGGLVQRTGGEFVWQLPGASPTLASCPSFRLRFEASVVTLPWSLRGEGSQA